MLALPEAQPALAAVAAPKTGKLPEFAGFESQVVAVAKVARA